MATRHIYQVAIYGAEDEKVRRALELSGETVNAVLKKLLLAWADDVLGTASTQPTHTGDAAEVTLGQLREAEHHLSRVRVALETSLAHCEVVTP